MYQSLLTRRYLTSKVLPLLAVLAVALCTAMVLIVWSVMGGFLAMLLSSGQTLFGDVTISGPVQGFPYYEELIERLEADDAIAAAAPIIEAKGLLATPNDNLTHLVTVMGVEGKSYDAVTGYHDTIWWKPLDEPLPKDRDRDDLRLEVDPVLEEWALELTAPDPETGEPAPAMVMGIEVGSVNERMIGGWYEPRWLRIGTDQVTLSVLPISQQGVAIDVRARRFRVVNQFRTGVYDIDASTVLVRLDALQEMLRMDRAERVEIAPPEPWAEPGEVGEPRVVGVEPARVTSVMVRAAPGVDAETAKQRATGIYVNFAADHPGEAPVMASIRRWDERPGIATFIAAVKKETGLVLVLFAFISIVAVFLVLAIFWSIVSEKTKDIGVLRSIGASRAGVAWLFLRYGLIIGVLGAALGGLLAVTIVWNINPIHDWLGTALGLYVWDPQIYHFPEIPSKVEADKAAIVLIVGVLSAVAGALLPAMKAAYMDPVRSLRFE